MQVPADTRVSVVPDTVQVPVVAEVNVTARPELVVADSVSGEADSEALDSAPNVTVWLALAIEPDTVAPVAVAGVPWLSVALIA